MAYTKNHAPWSVGDLVTTSIMDNFETIYTEASSYLSSHNHDNLYETQTEMRAAYWYAGNDGPSSGSDADLIYKSTGNLHASSFSGLGVATGLIIMWSGGSVPSGWHLCDGTVGTVDLRDRFVLGAGHIYAVGENATGTHAPTGTLTVAGHSLTAAEVNGHVHSRSDYYSDSSGGTLWYQYQYGNYYANHWRAGADSTTRTTENSNIGKSPADAHTHSAGEGTAFTGSNYTVLPPFYALAFIQKI